MALTSTKVTPANVMWTTITPYGIDTEVARLSSSTSQTMVNAPGGCFGTCSSKRRSLKKTFSPDMFVDQIGENDGGTSGWIKQASQAVVANVPTPETKPRCSPSHSRVAARCCPACRITFDRGDFF